MKKLRTVNFMPTNFISSQSDILHAATGYYRFLRVFFLVFVIYVFGISLYYVFFDYVLGIWSTLYTYWTARLHTAYILNKNWETNCSAYSLLKRDYHVSYHRLSIIRAFDWDRLEYRAFPIIFSHRYKLISSACVWLTLFINTNLEFFHKLHRRVEE